MRRRTTNTEERLFLQLLCQKYHRTERLPRQLQGRHSHQRFRCVAWWVDAASWPLICLVYSLLSYSTSQDLLNFQTWIFPPKPTLPEVTSHEAVYQTWLSLEPQKAFEGCSLHTLTRNLWSSLLSSDVWLYSKTLKSYLLISAIHLPLNRISPVVALWIVQFLIWPCGFI